MIFSQVLMGHITGSSGNFYSLPISALLIEMHELLIHLDYVMVNIPGHKCLLIIWLFFVGYRSTRTSIVDGLNAIDKANVPINIGATPHRRLRSHASLCCYS